MTRSKPMTWAEFKNYVVNILVAQVKSNKHITDKWFIFYNNKIFYFLKVLQQVNTLFYFNLSIIISIISIHARTLIYIYIYIHTKFVYITCYYSFYYIYIENIFVLNFILHVYKFKIVCIKRLPWTIFIFCMLLLWYTKHLCSLV